GLVWWMLPAAGLILLVALLVAATLVPWLTGGLAAPAGARQGQGRARAAAPRGGQAGAGARRADLLGGGPARGRTRAARQRRDGRAARAHLRGGRRAFAPPRGKPPPPRRRAGPHTPPP